MGRLRDRGPVEDPQSFIELIWRLTGDPLRAVIFIGVLAALTGMAVWFLGASSGVAPASAAGSAGVAVIVVLALRHAILTRRR